MSLTTFGVLGLGTPELIVILVIVLLLFGGTQLPKLARSLRSSMDELKSDKKGTKPADKDTTSTEK